MFTQTDLRACVFVLKGFICHMECFDWLPILRSLRDDTKNDKIGGCLDEKTRTGASFIPG